MTSNTAPAAAAPAADALPTTVVVPAGHRIHISAETASRDYTAIAVGGTYAIEYTDVNYRPVPAGEHPYYALVRVQVVSPQRRQPSAILGGVTVATEEIAESTHEHTLVNYAYRLRGKSMVDGLTLIYPAAGSAPVHITAPDLASVADITDVIETDGGDPERAHFYVEIDGRVHALVFNGLDGDGDVTFTVGEQV